MGADLAIAPLAEANIAEIAAAFAVPAWNKPASLYERYLAEQERGERVVLIARSGGIFAGYLTIAWASGYPPFREALIPEISDFSVLLPFRRRGIGGRLMEAAETTIAGRSSALYRRYPLFAIGALRTRRESF